MGSSSSKSLPKSGNSKTNNSDDELYAELISGKGIPPIKVYLNEKITSSAVESLKDSEVLANKVAKDLIMEALSEAETPNKFGELLKYCFQYEEIGSPTRGLVYWSLQQDYNINYTNLLVKYQIDYWCKNYGVNQVNNLTTWWLSQEQSRKNSIVPLLTWSLQQKSSVIIPLTNISTYYLPYAKDITKAALKYALTESLKSAEVKNMVRDGLLFYLKKATQNDKQVADNGEGLSADMVKSHPIITATVTNDNSPESKPPDYDDPLDPSQYEL